MKIVYELSLLQQIQAAIDKADMLGTAINFIELSDAEHKKLRKEMGIPGAEKSRYPVMRKVLGVQIKVIDERVDVTV